MVHWIFLKVALDHPRLHVTERYRCVGVVDPGRGPENDRDLQLFRKVERVDDQVLGFGHGRGLQDRQTGQLAVITVVLFVLTGEHERVVRR